MKKIVAYFLFLSLIALTGTAFADPPRWSFSMKGGYFMPDIDGWKDHYGNDGSWTGGLELGWKIMQQIELAGDIGYFGDSGTAITVTGRQSSDVISYNLIPVNISLLLRLTFSEHQIIVPYIGGGYSHVFYSQNTSENTRSGDQYGYHVRGGIQFLLDPLEPESAEDMEQIWGVTNTYFFLEGHYSKVDDLGGSNINIGGLTLLGGFLLEF